MGINVPLFHDFTVFLSAEAQAKAGSVSAYPPGIYIAELKDEKGLVSRGKFAKSGDR